MSRKDKYERDHGELGRELLCKNEEEKKIKMSEEREHKKK